MSDSFPRKEARSISRRESGVIGSQFRNQKENFVKSFAFLCVLGIPGIALGCPSLQLNSGYCNQNLVAPVVAYEAPIVVERQVLQLQDNHCQALQLNAYPAQLQVKQLKVKKARSTPVRDFLFRGGR